MVKYGVIDIGSNTIRLVIYRIIDGRIEYLLNEKVFARAVMHKQNGRMQIDGVKVIIDALTMLKELAAHHELSYLWCFATASLRNISNTDDVLASIREGTGFDVEIISGETEAELGVAGLKHAFDVNNVISIDLGGGSCEVTLIRNLKVQEKTSLPVGAVSITNQCVSGIFPQKNEIQHIKDEVDKHIDKIGWLTDAGLDAAYAMGGSARAMCNIHKAISKSSQEIHGYRIFSDDIKPLYTALIDRDLDGVRLADQHCPGRIFTLIPGMIILKRILIKARIPLIRLSRFGVREGYLLRQVDALENHGVT
jgi:exopolyphosphatase/guanosine-5'-triphosphate,3'-diphosphate pyrophosphatase